MGWSTETPTGSSIMPVPANTAVLHRMAMPGHTCPYGLKALDLLRRKGFMVDDRHLETRAATDAFKAENGVATTPQVFIAGHRIGGYDDLRRHLGVKVAPPSDLASTSFASAHATPNLPSEFAAKSARSRSSSGDSTSNCLLAASIS